MSWVKLLLISVCCDEAAGGTCLLTVALMVLAVTLLVLTVTLLMLTVTLLVLTVPLYSNALL